MSEQEQVTLRAVVRELQRLATDDEKSGYRAALGLLRPLVERVEQRIASLRADLPATFTSGTEADYRCRIIEELAAILGAAAEETGE